MNHNEYKKLIQLSLYGELSGEESLELEQHLSGCEECRKELEQQKNLLSVLNEHDKLKVDDKLLSDARVQLKGALKNERENRYSASRFADMLIEFISSPYRAALTGAVILAIGFFLGFLIFNSSAEIKYIATNQNNGEVSFTGSGVMIQNIRFIDSDATDREIEFTFDAVKTISLKGKLDDPKIQSILTYSMLNDMNPGSRLNSINAMATDKVLQYDAEVTEALITVLMNDENPGVRREALQVLKKLPFSEQIKKSYLYVIANDSVSGLRIDAINALADAIKQGSRLSSSEVDLFKTRLRTDKNNYIRFKTKTILQEYN